MDIVVCIDNGFVMPTGVMISSVCVNNPDVDVTFHIVCDESVSATDKDALGNTVCAFPGKQAKFYSIDSQAVDVFPQLSKLGPPPATYYRLFLTKILPETIDKVLYLDGDLIVRKSLLPLWDIDMTNHAIAAARDLCSNEMGSCNRLNYSTELGYVNCGVLLINLRYWRDNNVLTPFMDFIQKHRDILIFQDQDVLNFIFREKKLILPLEFNFQQHLLGLDCLKKYEREIMAAIKDPVVIHFSGLEKPWYAYIREPSPLSSTFYKYQSQTIWKDCRIDQRPFLLKVKNCLADIMRKLKIKAPLKKQFADFPAID